MNLPHKFVLALAAAAIAAPASAQIAQPAIQVGPGNTLLTVSAEGRSLRQPDMAVFSAGVTTQGDTAAEALGENSRAMTPPSPCFTKSHQDKRPLPGSRRMP